MGSIAAILFFVLAAGIGINIEKLNFNEAKTSNIAQQKSDSAKIALSGINIAKDALVQDDMWNDCSGAERYCEEDGYFPLYSPSLDSQMDGYKVNDGKLTVLMKSVNANEVRVISIGEVNGKKTFFAVKFSKQSSTDKVPLAYGASSRVEGGTVCSYYWDGTKVDGVTMPNFSVYLDSSFYWSPNIYVPRRASGPNPKDVRFATNYSTRVRGYRVIDKLYTTGDVSLENGAYVDYVYANGVVRTSGGSGYGEKVEHGNFQYPNFKSTFTDNRLGNRFGRRTVYCTHGTKYLAPGTYKNVFITGLCTLKLTGKNYKIKNLVSTAAGQIVFSDPDTVLKAKNIIVRNSSDIVYKSENGRDSFITIKAENISIGYNSWGWGWGGNSKLLCSDPLTCLIDTNNIDANRNNVIQGTLLVRNRADIEGSTVIGNVFAEDLNSRYATLCNIVDKDGSQLVSSGFFDIVDPNGTQFPAVIDEVKKTVCRDVDDCDAKLD